ncbi:MAG TPA: DUF5132 domain-containing protein [Acetobacteraceae bacterium]|nr:DUF5132 domain-containing protein [Acetobacteraceae bacterium]
MPRSYGTGLVTGIAISVIAAALAPLWRPAAARYGRQAAKVALKQGMVAYELSRDRMAEVSENVADMMAEVQVELATERANGEAAAEPL